MRRELEAWDTLLWRRARVVFDDVASVEAGERPAVLTAACGDDEALASAVLALLDHDDPTAKLGEGDAADGEGRRWLGSHLGPYRLLRVLGHGGAGIVFLAVRDDDEFDHRVAVKIHLDRLNAEATRRFRQERQFLAQFDHPHIARLIDGGSTGDGFPYVVMEYVEGLPVTAYCDRRRLSVDERLRLFLQVCDAVQHAHRCLVVHRDLKPGNILVTAAGQVKLLDFGIAKLLDEGAPPAGAGQRTTPWLTPAYASPEQLLGSATTIATDVYSLGAVLYEMLTGRLPFADRRGGPAGLAQPVAVPSAVVVGTPESPDAEASARAERRGSTPAQLRRRLSGDLDHVVLRALRDEPHARYPSVEALAADVERHLADLPVAARHGNASYRAGKFLRRHALAVTVAAALMLATLAFAAFALRQSIALASERDATQRQRVAAETVADDLADILHLMRPIAGQAFDPAIRQILGQTAARIEREFADQPELQVILSRAVGRVYLDLAFWDEAEPLLEGAVEHWRRHPSDPVERADALLCLAELREAQGRAADAEALARQALEAVREAPSLDPADLVATLTWLARTLRPQAKYEEARRLLEEAIEIGDRTAVQRQARASARNNLGLILKELGELEAAHDRYSEALALYREAGEPRGLRASSVLNNLASLAMARADFPAAAERFRESLEIRRPMQGDDHPTVAAIEANLAAVLHVSGDYEAAEPLYRAALARLRAARGPEHPGLAIGLTNLGVLLREMHRLEEAEELLREALRLRSRQLDADHPVTATSLNNLGLVFLDRDRIAEARESFEEALAIRRAKLGEGHWMVGNSLVNLAQTALAAGDPCAAARLAEEARSLLAEALPSGHWRHAEAGSVLGAALGRLGRPEAGVLLAESAAGIAAAKSERSRSSQDAEARLRAFRASPPASPVACPDGG